MTVEPDDEDRLLRAVTIQNANAILVARRRAEQELLQAKEALELKTGELAHSLAMLRATLESTTDGILVTDARGHVTDFNERYLAMWRLSRELVVSGRHAEIMEAISAQFADARPFVDRVEAIYAAASEETFDVLELADGRVFERYSRVQIVDTRNVGRVWSFRDITQNRRTEEALREETRVLELLNRTGTLLSSKLDLHGVVQAVTDAATELSGARFGAFFYNVSEHGDAYMLYTLSGARREDFERFGQPRATALFGATFRGEGPIRCADVPADPRYGQMPPHHGMPAGHLPVRSYLAVPVVFRSGEVIGGLFFGHPDPGVFSERAERIVVAVAAQAAIAIDNARMYEAAQKSAEERRHLLESERVARSEAERGSAMKDEFLATLSHELRTPLNAILGWSQMLRLSTLSESDRQRGLEIIERNTRVQAQLIEDLLDMSRITSGKLRLDIQPMAPAAVVEAALDTVRAAADAKEIRLTSVLDPAAGPVVGDAESPSTGGLEPALQRHQVHGQERPGAGASPARELPYRDQCHRHRDRHRARVLAARVRALPAGGCVQHPPGGWARSGPRHREAARRAPWGLGAGDQPGTGPRGDVHRGASAPGHSTRAPRGAPASHRPGHRPAGVHAAGPGRHQGAGGRR